jgi:purine-binding chemotaxis protein CheW
MDVVEERGQFLNFALGDEQFAVDVGKVEVVLEYVPITRVPKSPPWLRGVINHRGSVVPVMDLKRKMGMGETSEGEGASIIVLQVRYEGDEMALGILADEVREVVDVDYANVERGMTIGALAGQGFMQGVYKREGGFMLMLDIESVVGSAETEERAG